MTKIVIFRLPHRGPTDEFVPPLSSTLVVDASWVRPQDYDGNAQVIVLPGSGRTIDDLAALRESGGAEMVQRHLAQGGIVVGVCGGYQMLGQWLFDPALSQGSQPLVEGLGYLPHSTIFGPSHTEAGIKPPWLSSTTTGHLLVGRGNGGTIVGEERRSGFSFTNESSPFYLPLIAVQDRKLHEPLPDEEVIENVHWQPGREEVDGLVSADRRVWGTYLHRIFYNEAFLRTLFEVL